MKAYRIRDWKTRYENNRTKDMKVMRWVPVPNKHDGEGFMLIMEQEDGLQIYGCWNLILQVASKCEIRGTLVRNGMPHDAASIARKCSCRDVEAMRRAIEFCSSAQVSWIESFELYPAGACGMPAEKPQEPARKEGREGKERKGWNPPPPLLESSIKWTEEQVIEAGSRVGVLPADCRAFFAHYAPVNFIDGAGRSIESLPHALKKWQANQSSHGKTMAQTTPTAKPTDKQTFERYLNEILVEAEKIADWGMEEWERGLWDKYKDVPRVNGKHVVDAAKREIKRRTTK